MYQNKINLLKLILQYIKNKLVCHNPLCNVDHVHDIIIGYHLRMLLIINIEIYLLIDII